MEMILIVIWAVMVGHAVTDAAAGLHRAVQPRRTRRALTKRQRRARRAALAGRKAHLAQRRRLAARAKASRLSRRLRA